MCVCVCVCVCVSLQSSDDEEGVGKGRGRHILVNKTEMPAWTETLESFRTARESWDLLHSHEALETGTLPVIYPNDLQFIQILRLPD